MKKLLLISIFFLNVLPVWQNGEMSFFQVAQSQAQSQATNLPVLRDYLNSLNDGYVYQINGNMIQRTDPNNGAVSFIGWSDYMNNPGFQQYAGNQNITLPPNSNEDDDQEQNDDGIDWNEVAFEMDNLRTQARLDAFANIEWWGTHGGYEPNSNPQPCSEGMFDISFVNVFYEGVKSFNETGISSLSPSSLPCANKFLIGGNVIQFSASQVNNITKYDFDGSSLYSVQFNGTNGDIYRRGTSYDVIEEEMVYTPYSEYCPPPYIQKSYKLINKRGSYRFICFDKISYLSGVEVLTETETGSTFYKGIPDNVEGYVFTIPPSNITPAVAGQQVVGKTKNGVYYCITLTEEDVERGLKQTRDTKYIPASTAFKLDHPVNVPGWVRDFLELIALPLSQCTIDHVNDGLDALHQKSDYINESNEGSKAIMEYKSMAYDLLFGVLYCATDEESAKGKSCVAQAALGVMHEVASAIDVVQMKDGIVKIIQGLGNVVNQNVQNMVDGVKDVVVQHATTGVVDFDQIAKEFVAKNVSQANSIYTRAAAIANSFKKMYFTECDQYQFQDGSTGDICCYRDGQLAMMIVPILLTVGDYAVVKLTGLAAKYGARAAQAVEMLADAERFGAKVIDNAGQILIKESDEAGALVISTQEKVSSEIVITGEQDLKNILDEGDLNDVNVNNPVNNNVIQASPGNKTTGWNKDLNKALQPNKIYEVGNHKYTTNGDGLVTKVTCDNLQVNPSVGNKYQQTYKCKNVKDGVVGDDGGHLMAKQFGGAGEQINLVPMKSSINQAPGTWYQMETDWRNALNGGGSVTNVEINIIYGTNKRPVSFTVTADINGIPTQWSHTN